MINLEPKPIHKGNIEILKILVKNCFPLDYSNDLYIKIANDY